MTTIAIVYHSGYGHTEVIAKAVARGVESIEGIRLLFLKADEAQKQLDALTGCDAIIFGCPTYMGSAAASMKAFMEASSKVWMNQGWKDKIAAGFTNSGSQSGDKLNTLIQLMIFAMQHGMIWAGLGLMPGNNNSKGSVHDINRIGSFAGAMSQSNVDEGPEKSPIESDQQTAELLGRRVAEITRRWVKNS
ncbi:MAG: flavodoxin family protein [Desulfobacterales bacterium]|jgi:multimeric flavodoxin WrbA|nr:flavodoxin family protein [Desulfobacterales bacterium]